MIFREIVRADGGLLAAPTPESLHTRFGRHCSVKTTIWIIAKVCVYILEHSAQIRTVG